MKISFDLDETLIPAEKGDFDTEPLYWYHRILGLEPIRKGTARLIKQLKNEGHKIGVYTTSFRTRKRIWFTFLLYGISLDFIINEALNRNRLSIEGVQSSKYPPAFSIDLHIDDSKGVEIEGRRLNFLAIIVNADDLGWDQMILERVRKLCKT